VSHGCSQERAWRNLLALPRDADLEDFGYGAEAPVNSLPASRQTRDTELPDMSRERGTETVQGGLQLIASVAIEMILRERRTRTTQLLASRHIAFSATRLIRLRGGDKLQA